MNQNSSMAKEYIEERDGGYYVAGTRVSLDSIVQCFNEGLSPEAILEEFGTLTLAQVFGAMQVFTFGVASGAGPRPAADALVGFPGSCRMWKSRTGDPPHNVRGQALQIAELSRAEQ
jgi:uncharacterized protein (DUF433 family)